MKRKIKSLALIFISSLFINGIIAQETITANAVGENISDNLDLKAVASIFGEAKNLQEFENKLNDPKTQISNLDLNGDNFVDYLRVVETVENDAHVVAIQSVLDNDQYQDVATIAVEKESDDNTSVQIIGDVYLYGTNYIIEPVYVHRPLIFSIFWRPLYRPFSSLYYWGHYPHYFHYWHPFRLKIYRKNIHAHINWRHRYNHTSRRRSRVAAHLTLKNRRNDFERLGLFLVFVTFFLVPLGLLNTAVLFLVPSALFTAIVRI
jgi:hypothetical protein